MEKQEYKISILSDIHLRTSAVRKGLLRTALKNIRRTPGGCDLFISVGDTSDHGDKAQWFAFQQLYEQTAPAEHAILALGNHDTWTHPYAGHTEEEEFIRALPLYLDCRRKITGFVSDKAYYSTVIHGFPFIMTGTSGSGVGADVDAEQIAWFCDALKKAAAYDTFIFVISHWAMRRTHGLPRTFSAKHDDFDDDACSLGAGGEQMREEMKKYKNVIFISGHSHMGWRPAADYKEIGFASVENVDGILSVNLPCFIAVNHDGRLNMPGLGLDIKLTRDEVCFCPRNYLLSLPMDRFSFAVKKS